MREKRMLQNSRLRGTAMKAGLEVGTEVIIQERSLLKDGTYITRMIRRGMVRKLYAYHFSCCMEDGTLESFRYNELLGWEARLIRMKGNKMMENRKVPERVLFYENGGIWKEISQKTVDLSCRIKLPFALYFLQNV